MSWLYSSTITQHCLRSPRPARRHSIAEPQARYDLPAGPHSDGKQGKARQAIVGATYGDDEIGGAGLPSFGFPAFTLPSAEIWRAMT